MTWMFWPPTCLFLRLKEIMFFPEAESQTCWMASDLKGIVFHWKCHSPHSCTRPQGQSTLPFYQASPGYCVYLLETKRRWEINSSQFVFFFSEVQLRWFCHVSTHPFENVSILCIYSNAVFSPNCILKGTLLFHQHVHAWRFLPWGTLLFIVSGTVHCLFSQSSVCGDLLMIKRLM